MILSVTSNTSTPTSAATRNGCNASASRCGMIGRVENTITKVSRYSASGTTQSSGTAATSVEMCAVTATSSPDGTAASAVQTRASRQVGAGASASLEVS